MNRPAIQFAALRCQPTLNSSNARPVDLAGGASLQYCALDDVLYIPELALQLTGDAGVPLESVLDPWALQFEVKRGFQGRTPRYQLPFTSERIDADVCILANFYSRNFFHWVTEEMIRVAALEAAGFTGCYVIAGLPDFCRQFLGLYGVAESRLIMTLPGPVTFNRVQYVTPVHARMAVQHAGVYLHVRDRLLQAVNETKPEPRLIWLERLTAVNNAGRHLANPEDVMPMLKSFGIEPVDMGALPVTQQIATSRDARFLGGAHGAGFVHCLFMEHRSAVMECYAPTFINPGIHGICSILEHDYAMLVYELAYDGYSDGGEVRVSAEHLELHLKRLKREGKLG